MSALLVFKGTASLLRAVEGGKQFGGAGESHREKRDIATHLTSRFAQLQSQAESIPLCQLVLDNSKQPQALLLASQSLLRLITQVRAKKTGRNFTECDHAQFFNKFSKEQTVDIRNYLLTYLANHVDQKARACCRARDVTE